MGCGKSKHAVEAAEPVKRQTNSKLNTRISANINNAAINTPQLQPSAGMTTAKADTDKSIDEANEKGTQPSESSSESSVSDNENSKQEPAVAAAAAAAEIKGGDAVPVTAVGGGNGGAEARNHDRTFSRDSQASDIFSDADNGDGQVGAAAAALQAGDIGSNVGGGDASGLSPDYKAKAELNVKKDDELSVKEVGNGSFVVAAKEVAPVVEEKKEGLAQGKTEEKAAIASKEKVEDANHQVDAVKAAEVEGFRVSQPQIDAVIAEDGVENLETKMPAAAESLPEKAI